MGMPPDSNDLCEVKVVQADSTVVEGLVLDSSNDTLTVLPDWGALISSGGGNWTPLTNQPGLRSSNGDTLIALYDPFALVSSRGDTLTIRVALNDVLSVKHRCSSLGWW